MHNGWYQHILKASCDWYSWLELAFQLKKADVRQVIQLVQFNLTLHCSFWFCVSKRYNVCFCSQHFGLFLVCLVLNYMDITFLKYNIMSLSLFFFSFWCFIFVPKICAYIWNIGYCSLWYIFEYELKKVRCDAASNVKNIYSRLLLFPSRHIPTLLTRCQLLQQSLSCQIYPYLCISHACTEPYLELSVFFCGFLTHSPHTWMAFWQPTLHIVQSKPFRKIHTNIDIYIYVCNYKYYENSLPEIN